ncbi:MULTISPECIES: FadR/GntR family transcriptional regulator [Ochrobactrum]|uniref:FadR family transcriptional regulator n=1 Tax=Ochrobactrum quorumnocens TaxID=271865 RepID=A0A5N1K663_9HYPH|nr:MULTISPECIES: FadR/GntR family transcriptional regulator [Brucella/Ochrobactrum group]KAA9369704.1 FadR family transcriptional regulator [[Ochrobactrum] quorumnocens]MCV9906807.1 FadR family transcriptional regulator [Brucella sp. HL-2]MDH7790881.1 GntR family transcriptional repressor for pyruvate dehydrogenase complex [Ochrobactrum sp. AN78]
MFGEIRRNEQLPARIASEIVRQITEGSFLPGHKLPTEHNLAQSFGVSRSVIREAIAQLRNEGLIETRQGVGAFVTEPDRRHAIRIEPETLADRDHFQSLFQLRMALEIEAAGLAAVHHTAEDMCKLDEALSAMNGREKWTDEGISADLTFHRALAAATHNEYFPLVLGFIAERISQAIRAARARAVLEEIVEITIAEHTAIRDAIALRDPLKAREVMRNHVVGAASRVNLQLETF